MHSNPEILSSLILFYFTLLLHSMYYFIKYKTSYLCIMSMVYYLSFPERM